MASTASIATRAVLVFGTAAVFLAARCWANRATDPCALLSANEAQTYVGVLTTPPFRANDVGAPDAHGDQCMYRGSGGRQLGITWNAAGAGAAGNITESVPNTLGGAFDKAGEPGLAATAHRVIAQGPSGPWDRVSWIPGGTLFVTKGDQGVNIDVSGASGNEADALAIARLALPRFNRPLAYDGAAAAAHAPSMKPHSDACAVVRTSAVESAVGPLARPPTLSADHTGCEYRVTTPQGERIYAVEFVWQGGLKNYNMLKNGSATLGSAMGASHPMDGLDSMPHDAQTSALIGGLMKLAGGNAPGAAPGAATQVGFKTDSSLKGPWDNATLLHGTQLLAVKADVMVGMDLTSADYEGAKALMAAICSRL
jgi:hypothetical protein